MSRKKPRERPIVAATFGAYLTTLRGQASREAICQKLEKYGLTLDRSTLLQYEHGTVESPNPAILWALAQIFRVPTDDLVARLVHDVSKKRNQLFHQVADPLTPHQRTIAELAGGLSDAACVTLIAFLEALREQPTPDPDRDFRAL